MTHLASSLLCILLFLTAVESSGHHPHGHGHHQHRHSHQHRQSRARAYLEEQCQVTLFKELCVEGLLTNEKTITSKGPQEIAQFALTVSLMRALYTKAYVSWVADKLSGRDSQAVKDCLKQIKDGVDQITLSIQELRSMGRDKDEKRFIWHQNNVESWVSAALTDATTCMDGLPRHAVGGKVKATIKAKVLNVAQLTSNALALFNRFTARHRASHVIRNP